MIFKAPKSKYEYLFGQSMFETIWNTYLFLTTFFFVMSIKFIITGNPIMITLIGAFVVSLLTLMILNKWLAQMDVLKLMILQQMEKFIIF